MATLRDENEDYAELARAGAEGRWLDGRPGRKPGRPPSDNPDKAAAGSVIDPEIARIDDAIQACLTFPPQERDSRMTFMLNRGHRDIGFKYFDGIDTAIEGHTQGPRGVSVTPKVQNRVSAWREMEFLRRAW